MSKLSPTIEHEALVAYRWRIPDSLNVAIRSSKDGGYVARVHEFPGCVTQAQTGEELIEMVNDAVFTYLQIPRAYRIYMPVFLPPEDARKELIERVPAKYLRNEVELVRA